jgi:hypothetical protein
MSGGALISLVANGAQDVYLTGDPSITFFKVIYRRHTNFALEAIEQSYEGRSFGRHTTIIQRNGDLMTKTAVRVRLPAVRSDVVGNKLNKIAYVRRLGHALIQHAELFVGGMSIDKQYGTWMDIWYELTHTQEQERGYNELIGDVDELTTLTGKEADDGRSEVLLPAAELLIPLQFWFCQNYGLALPLIALQYHEVRLDLYLSPIEKLMVYTGEAPNLSNYTLADLGLLIDYVYLESSERRKYAQLAHEYLFSQIQFTGAENVYSNGGTQSINQKVKINYNHPTKELIWALKLGAFSGKGNKSQFAGGRGRFLCYTNDDSAWKTAALDYAAKNLVEGCVFINPPCISDDHGCIEGRRVHRVESEEDNDGHRVAVNLINHDVSCLSSCGTSSCSSTTEPCMDDINNTDIKVYVYDTLLCDDFTLLGNDTFEMFDLIDSAVVEVKHTNGCNVSINCVEVKHRLNLNDVSVPIEDFSYDYRSANDSSRCVHRDVTVTQPNNYGLRLDGRGNPVMHGNIQLNGHKRIETKSGNYFNYYQPNNHHTRTPADGINVYSFALSPEKHQPSGTTNLSRIDNTILDITLGDRLRENSALKLDYAKDTELYIYGYSYNILRVMSGMGGVAYSS